MCQCLNYWWQWETPDHTLFLPRWIQSSLLCLSCALSIPGSAAATRRNNCVCVCEGGGGRWERTCEDVHINSMNCPRMYVWCTDMGSNYWVSNQGFNCMIAACQRSYVCSWGNTHIMWHYVVLFMITVSDNNTTTSSATNTSCTQQWPTASLSYLLNIVTSFCTRLDEHNVELLCFPLSLLHRHLTLVLQICLVSHKHDNHVIPPFCTYVFNPFVHLLKRVCICGRGICECGIHDIEAVNVCLPFSKASFQGHTHYCSELGNKCDGRLVTSISLYTCTVSLSGSSVRWGETLGMRLTRPYIVAS